MNTYRVGIGYMYVIKYTYSRCFIFTSSGPIMLITPLTFTSHRSNHHYIIIIIVIHKYYH